MAAGSTYTPIATTTLGSAQSSVTLNSFSGYTDIVIIGSVKLTSGANSSMGFQVNGDTGSNYSYTYVRGDGSTTESGRGTSRTYGNFSGGNFRVADSSNNYSPLIFNMMNYANTSTYKTFLNRGNDASLGGVGASVSLWRSTSAITSITIFPFAGSIDTGSTFTLYGIQAA
jgi:hypothetical protein